MAILGSYNVSEFAADTTAEIERLGAQVDLFWDQELAFYEQLGLRDGQTVLDCGCGPGHLLFKLKSRFPNIHCTGIDIDPGLIAIASGANQGDCQFLEQSVCSIGFPDSSFDFVVARLVLEHTPKPSAGALEILRVLKPGGIAVFVDNDFDLHEQTFPPCPALSALYEAYRESRRSDGGNPCLGRELPVLLKTSGYGNVQLKALAAHSELNGDEAFLRAEGSGIPAQLVKKGFLASDTLERVALEWMQMLETPGHSILRVIFAAAGSKLQGVAAPGIASLETLCSARISEATELSRDSARGNASQDLRKFIQSTLADEMNIPPESLNFTEPLIHLGVDSIAALHLCNRLKTCMGFSIPLAEVLCGKSIEAIASEILELEESQSRQTNSSINLQPRAGDL